jgi:hypothetical protein
MSGRKIIGHTMRKLLSRDEGHLWLVYNCMIIFVNSRRGVEGYGIEGYNLIANQARLYDNRSNMEKLKFRNVYKDISNIR